MLTLDWDLEAPGLHRCFHPFLVDKDQTSSDGIIDFVIKFAEAALVPYSHRRGDEVVSRKESQGAIEQASLPDERDAVDNNWYRPYANILRYASSLDWKFRDGGRIDFIPAGRQGPSYATRVNLFSWDTF